MNDNNKRMEHYLIVLLVFFSILPSMSFAAEGWTRKADMPTARCYLSSSAVNGKIYVIGGRRGGQLFSIVEVYDPATDTWTRKTGMPAGRWDLSTSVVNGKIYAIGGIGSGGPSPTVEEYDPVTDTWTRKADMLKGRALDTSVVNGKIYAIGGMSSPFVQIYDPATDTWTVGADIPTPRQFPSVSVVDGKIYAIGGNAVVSPWQVLSIVEEYDPDTDTWTKKSDMPTARGELSTTVANGIIYAIGGYTNHGQDTNINIADALLSTVEAYNPKTDTWIGKSDMPTPRTRFSTSSVNRMIYAIGGQPGSWPAVTDAVEAYQVGPRGFAVDPSPGNGTLHLDTGVVLDWIAGDFAVSHDVYFGDNFNDVNAGAESMFQANQTADFFLAGFPGYAYPDGLVPGSTYYWRIDEVNDADPNSPWKGPVWSFSIPLKNAYDPVPSDGSKFIDSENLILTWTPGYDAILHTVYFGDDYETVANASGGTPVGPNFSTGPLELEKMYFWRVDEFDDTQATHTGEVWSFTTAKEGGGIRGDYYNGMNFENLMVTRIDPQINFSWSNGGPDPLVGDDQYSVIWTGEVEAVFTETYTFETCTDDGARLWIGGQQLIDDWSNHIAYPISGQIDLVAGNTYSVVMQYYEDGGSAVAELRWSSPSTPKQFIPQAALSPLVKANSPSPVNGASGTKMTPILKWRMGDFAASHEVYFGTDANAVKNATTASPEYKGLRALGDESYDPGKLAWFTEYFWRIDEVNNLNPDSPCIGNLWSFKTGDFFIIDDFEDYDAGDNRIWYSWHDGIGYGEPGTDRYFAGNGTGAMIGDETTPSYCEETIIHGGRQAMPYWYDNNKQGYANYSETELTLMAPRDWTEEGVTRLSLWFRGYPAYVGSFVEGPAGTYTMTSSGGDIWWLLDEFHFAYKVLSGPGSIVARVDSIEENTHEWAKAGVMIRETLNPDSVHAFSCLAASQGISFQGREITGSSDHFFTNQDDITSPHWLKLERDVGGNFMAYHSADGSNWQSVENSTPVNVPMNSDVYIGLAVSSNYPIYTTEAVFSNVTITGTVSPQWTNQDIGILSNDAEPLYVAIANSDGEPAVVYHDDPAASTVVTWTEWIIPIQAFADQGIVLTDVDRIAIGLGTQGNMTIPGGSGKMYFDDIRLYRPIDDIGE
ncbi:PA14 domain-containing protein [Planctomycetota bacterium]